MPLLVLATWALCGLVIVGFGLPFAALTRAVGPALVRTAMWTGLALAFAVVGLVHLWSAMSQAVAVGILVAAAVCATVGLGMGAADRLTRRWRSPGIAVLLLAAAIVVALAVGSGLTPTHYDAGLYYLQAIDLAHEHPLIAGLANLSTPLGYATTHFPVAALLDAGPLGDDGYRALNGLFACTLIADLVLRRSSRSHAAGDAVSAVGCVLVLVPVAVLAGDLLASPTIDTSVFVLSVASAAALADVVWRGTVRAVDIVVALVPLALATSMRPQAAALLVGAAVVVAVVLWRRRRATRVAGATALVAAIVVVLAGVTAARDRVLSGWLGYPLTYLGWDVPWRADEAVAAAGRTATIAIARDPGPEYQLAASGYAWLPAWVGRLPHAWEFWLCLVLVAGSVVLALVTARGQRALRWRALALAIAPFALASALWVLVLPPTWRMGWGAVLGGLALVVGWLLTTAGAPGRLVAVASLTVVLVAVVLSALVRWPDKPDALPVPDVRLETLSSGLVVAVPTTSDQCWAHDPPCTPYPDPRLVPLGDALGDGFALSPSAPAP